jgi:hypothetical protein
VIGSASRPVSCSALAIESADSIIGMAAGSGPPDSRAWWWKIERDSHATLVFMTAPGSGNFVPMASDVILADSRTNWVLTLSAEHTVLASGDRTMSLFGDLFLPLGSTGHAPKTVDVRTPAQTALIGGVRIRSK